MRLVSLLLVVMLMAWPASAQDDNTAGLLDTLLGGGVIRENIVFREPIANGSYELTLYGSRVQGMGYLEISLTDTETDEQVGAETTMAVTLQRGDARGGVQRFDATYQNGHFLVEDIDFIDEGDYDLTMRLDGSAPLRTDFYVYPSAPDAPPALIVFSLLGPLTLLLGLLLIYRIFRVRYLPEPRTENNA